MMEGFLSLSLCSEGRLNTPFSSSWPSLEEQSLWLREREREKARNEPFRAIFFDAHDSRDLGGAQAVVRPATSHSLHSFLGLITDLCTPQAHHACLLTLRHVSILYLKRTKISLATPTFYYPWVLVGVKMSDRVQESVQNAILRRIDEELVESKLNFTLYFASPPKLAASVF